ncbi:MAG: hypothetical protein GY774_20695 [Planctomycetes bacterium]|nr:hypothetical protein [Planctomycetota bacterium]
MRSVKLWRDVDKLEEYKFTNKEFAEFLRDNIDLIKDGYRIYDGHCAKSKDITEDAKKVTKCQDIVILKPMGDPVTLAIGVVASLVISAVAVRLLVPKIETPDGSFKQSSPTNRFGSRENTLYDGGRTDDVWGYVPRYVPRLIQADRTYFVNGDEFEEFTMSMMGEIDIKNGIVRDGETNFKNLPGGCFNKWNPGENLLSDPSFKIGTSLAGQIPKITQSEELQAQEILPPNDLDLGQVNWTVSTVDNGSNTYDVTITGSNLDELGVLLSDYIQTGDNFDVINFITSKVVGTKTVYQYSPLDQQWTSIDIQEIGPSVLDGNYISTNVTENKIEFTTSNSEWLGVTASISSYYTIKNGLSDSDPGYLEFKTLDDRIKDGRYYSVESQTTQYELDSITTSNNPSIGKINSNIVGPIFPPEEVTFLHFNFFSDGGCYKLVKNNEQRVSINCELIIDEIDASENPTGQSYVEPFTYESHPNKISRSTGQTVSIPRPPYSKYQVSARRLTNRDKSSNVQAIDKIFWTEFYYEEAVPLPDNSESTIMKARIPSSAASRGVKKRLINFDATRVFEPYIGNGKFGPKQPVSTFAETLIGMALDKYNGRLTLGQIDADTLLDVQDQLVAYYGFNSYVELGYCFDNTKVRFQEAYKLLCTAVNCQAYAQGGIFKAYPDIAQGESKQQYTHRYKIMGSDTKSVSDNREHDGVEIIYRNEKGEEKTVRRHLYGNNSYNPLKITLSGCFQESVATIRADREINIMKYQRYTYSFDSDALGLLAVPSYRVDNVDLTRIPSREGAENNYKVYDGYVKDIQGLTVLLSEPVQFESGQTHSIRFAKKNGSLMPSIACTSGPSAYHVILQQAPEEVLATDYMGERTSFTFASDSNRESLPCLIRSIKGKKVKGLDARSLTCVNYDERYYQNDKQFAGVN